MTQSILDVAAYFLWLDNEREGDGISNMKLQKPAYYAQGFHLALFDTALFDERVEAWDHGPVVPHCTASTSPTDVRRFRLRPVSIASLFRPRRAIFSTRYSMSTAATPHGTCAP